METTKTIFKKIAGDPAESLTSAAKICGCLGGAYAGARIGTTVSPLLGTIAGAAIGGMSGKTAASWATKKFLDFCCVDEKSD